MRLFLKSYVNSKYCILITLLPFVHVFLNVEPLEKLYVLFVIKYVTWLRTNSTVEISRHIGGVEMVIYIHKLFCKNNLTIIPIIFLVLRGSMVEDREYVIEIKFHY